MNDNTAHIGAFGSFTALLASGVSTIEQIDLWMRVATSFVGLLVGLITLVYIFRKNKKL